jgi:regulator of cell morphogenesis and NO signaling
MLFHAQMKMADVIHSNYILIPVINRLGVQLGFGDRTVAQTCEEIGLDSDFFLLIVNTFGNDDYFPEKKFKTFDIKGFIKYFQKTHDYYLTIQIPKIDHLIEDLAATSKQNEPRYRLILQFFKDYKQELNEHIALEEDVTFPYIETLYKMYHDSFEIQLYREVTKNYSMNRFLSEHSNIDEKISDLLSLLIKYIPSNGDEVIVNAIIFELFRLEKDIKDHTRLEEKILKPMVAELEASLKQFVL